MGGRHYDLRVQCGSPTMWRSHVSSRRCQNETECRVLQVVTVLNRGSRVPVEEGEFETKPRIQVLCCIKESDHIPNPYNTARKFIVYIFLVFRDGRAFSVFNLLLIASCTFLFVNVVSKYFNFFNFSTF